MSTTMIVGLLISLALLVFVLSPFWLGAGGLLVPSALLDDPVQIRKLKAIILERYVKEEQAAAKGEISKGEWRQRQQFLTNRYIDLTRRFDYLQHMASLVAAQKRQSPQAPNT